MKKSSALKTSLQKGILAMWHGKEKHPGRSANWTAQFGYAVKWVVDGVDKIVLTYTDPHTKAVTNLGYITPGEYDAICSFITDQSNSSAAYRQVMTRQLWKDIYAVEERVFKVAKDLDIGP